MRWAAIMGIDELLAKLQREAVTPVTPQHTDGVTAEALPILACTLVTPVTPKNSNAGERAAFYRWLIHFADRNPLEVAFSPPARHGEVLADYPDALAAQPIEPAHPAS